MNSPELGRTLSLRGLCISYGDRQVLGEVDLDLPAKGVTVLLGPSGTGKSTLLRTIAGENGGLPSICVKGHIGYKLPNERPPLVRQKAKLLLSSLFENLVGDWPERATLTASQQRSHVAQWLTSLDLERLVQHLRVPVLDLPVADQRLATVLRIAMRRAPLLLLDEPTAGLSNERAQPILALIRRLRQQGSLFVAMHNLSQTLAIADSVVLLASRRVQEHSSAHAFFSEPASESGRLFLRTGSCPEEPHPEPDVAAVAMQAPQNSSQALGPHGFKWLIPGKLAGTPWPGLLHSAAYDLELLRVAGITRLLSVTDRTLPVELTHAYGMAVENSPIVDMHPPSVSQALALCQRLEALLASGEAVAVHCHAGLGRTGTTLCAYWIWMHRGCTTGELALQQVRRIHPGWVQSAAQVDFLHVFAAVVARMKTTASSTSSLMDASDPAELAQHSTTTPR